VSGRLAREIKQSKPFDSLEAEAFLNLGRTWEYLQSRVADFLKPHQLTPTQYNMLRILRGAGADGLSCSEACDRMITMESDITRLLDRLEARNLIRRERSKEDRRVVVTTITEQGLTVLKEIDDPLKKLLRRDIGHLGQRRLVDLIGTLEVLREPAT
jgi:DNA-binding MarR family transcriptional regulator